MPRSSMPGARRSLDRTIRWSGAWLLAVACHPAPSSDPPAPSSPPPQIAPEDPPADPARSPCGPTGEGFDDYAWAPETAPAVASIQLDAPDLAATLSALGDHVRGPGHGLPIPLAFSLGQWSWQIPTLAATLGHAGFHPRELVFVAGDDGDHAWIWRSTCDLDEAVQRMETAWSVSSRRTVEGMVASPSADAPPPAFPHDVLMLPGQRMALVPAGQATAVLERFARPAPRLGLGATPVPTAGRRLEALPPAPIRLVFVGRALLDSSTASADHEPRLLRVTAQGVEPEPTSRPEDASLPSPTP